MRRSCYPNDSDQFVIRSEALGVRIISNKRRHLLVLLIVLAAPQYACAELREDGGQRFDGSEFKASTFVDTTFDQQTDRGVPGEERRAEQLDRLPGSSSDLLKMCLSKECIKSSNDQDDKLSAQNVGENLNERTGPVHELPGDWVPDKIDVTSNGGFTTSPDNGAPVPYRLNGHIDVQRGRPWEVHD
jgi:hypothetical protein